MSRDRIRVLLVAESDVLAATIEAGLRDETGVSITVGRPRALRHLIEEHEPGAVILAGSESRFEAALATLAGVLRVPPVIVLADEPRLAWTAAARRAGVHAVLRRDAPGEHIVAAIDSAAAGLFTLHPDVFAAAARSTLGSAAEKEEPLTGREREILEMMAEGLSNRMIARRLGISMYTVKFHVASILAKLGAVSRTKAVTLGVRRGLISL